MRFSICSSINTKKNKFPTRCLSARFSHGIQISIVARRCRVSRVTIVKPCDLNNRFWWLQYLRVQRLPVMTPDKIFQREQFDYLYIITVLPVDDSKIKSYPYYTFDELRNYPANIMVSFETVMISSICEIKDDIFFAIYVCMFIYTFVYYFFCLNFIL